MYSAALWEHFESPKHRGRPESFQLSVRQSNPICGDDLELFLGYDSHQNVTLSFEARACPPVVAGASMVCQWARGRSRQELLALRAEEIGEWLAPLPPQKKHAVALLWLGLQELCQQSESGMDQDPPR